MDTHWFVAVCVCRVHGRPPFRKGAGERDAADWPTSGYCVCGAQAAATFFLGHGIPPSDAQEW